MSDVLAALGNLAATEREAFSDQSGSITYAALARRVAGTAAALQNLPPVLGLLGPSSIDWLVTDLAAWMAGKTLVPLPHFFADAQLKHILSDAGITTVLAADDQMARAQAFNIAVMPLPRDEAAWQPAVMRGTRIVYTSGSTGAPKGVLLGANQMRQSCAALLQASGAGAADRHLSVLPYALLLEAICGIYLPILVGGSCAIDATVVAAQGPEIAVRLGEAAARERPSTTVLVPQLLQAWVMMASIGRVAVPDSLRFVAVGGAAVPDSIAARAWELGIPVHEGYGLTECCSVVAVNRPGDRRGGTVGRPLPGCAVSIAPDGEIVVRGPAVAQGYLGRSDGPADDLWHTGDLGSLDADGYLRVTGRKDNLIVTANGRNIAPEWVETMLLADPRIGRCVVLVAPDGQLAVLLEASPLGAAWLGKADPARLAGLVATLAAAAPDYAIPHRIAVIAPDGLAAAGLLTANGRPRRREIAARYPDFFPAHDGQTMEMQHAVF
ncbi:MAG: AMP-binding protein [Ferrovibrio sp.]|uniref:AMP-binding protein n=1 Tax=Ferrovibrio sp. TaxID=1917215 RepID=UPI002601F0A0|nr:AMP-binding protein [Ferrovibrio sp.]MCW0234832.1 AMP-binding protein [Ferrovibrio sp.]